MMKHIILTVGLRQNILKHRNWRIVPSFDLEEASRVAANRRLSLILIDLEYFKDDIRSFIKQVRAAQNAPVLALGQAEDSYDWPVFQETDFFLPLSAPSWQIVAYVSAMLHTNENIGSFLRPDPTQSWPIQQGDFFVDQINCWANVRGKIVYLHEDETSLLVFLLMHTHMALPYRRVSFWVQLNSYGTDESFLVAKLRDQIEPDPAEPVYIQDLPEIGYCFYDTLDQM